MIVTMLASQVDVISYLFCEVFEEVVDSHVSVGAADGSGLDGGRISGAT